MSWNKNIHNIRVLDFSCLMLAVGSLTKESFPAPHQMYPHTGEQQQRLKVMREREKKQVFEGEVRLGEGENNE